MLVSIIILLGPVLLRLKLVCKCHQGRSKQQLLTVMTNVFLSMFKLLFLKKCIFFIQNQKIAKYLSFKYLILQNFNGQ